MSAAVLLYALEVAVPLWIQRWAAHSTAERAARAVELADVIASHGDHILYRSKKRGGTADAFNALAEALAIAACQPGGVTFGELHFEHRGES